MSASPQPPQPPQPLLIASAPNGAYKTRTHHDQLPVTAAQLADTAVAVRQAGARMIHLHVRDANGKHTLDAGTYKAAIESIRAKVGDDFFIQLTSEAADVYDAEAQRRTMYAVCADGVSIALRELIRTHDERDECDDLASAKKLFHHLAAQGVLVQYILFSIDDIHRYGALLAQGVIPAGGHSVLLVVGRYDEGKSTPDALHRMVEALRASTEQPVNWMVCAFGPHEFDCLVAATKLGGHVRVGFENCLVLRCGRTAKDNRELITQLIESGNPDRRPLANAHQAREILGST